MSFLLLAKAKPQYVEKKKTPSGEIRIYDDSHVKKRWKEKVDKINRLEKDIKELRKKYKSDLTDDNDAKTRATAAIVGLIDNTAMRIGNEASVDEFGSFGATTLRKEHAKVSGNKIIFKFKGKKGVQQDVTLDDASIVSEIKKLLKNKKAKDLIFEYEDGKHIRGKVVNRYLKSFDITAKDIRGFFANHLMEEKLKTIKDFDKALEFVANEVGHEAKTLMSQYLNPALVKKYKKASLVVFAEINEIERIIDSIFKVVNIPPDKEAINETTVVPVTNKIPAPPIMVENESDEKIVWKKGDEVGAHYITSPYGKRDDPMTRNKAFHSGIDLRAREGTPVLAFGNGKVSIASFGKISGNFVVINHGDKLFSSYSHLSESLVTKGNTVKKGDIIGLAGSTGKSTAAHLHFSLKYKGNRVDPTSFLATRTVVGET